MLIFIFACLYAAMAASVLWVTPPYLAFWTLTVVTTEFGHFLAIPALILGIGFLFRKRLFISALFLCSAGLLLWPSIQSYQLGPTLGAAVAQSFGGNHQAVMGFSPLQAIMPWSSAESPPELVEFKRPDGSLGLFYFYPAVNRPHAPLVIVIHGGSWKAGNPLQLSALNSVLAKNGYAVAAVNYRLLTEGKPETRWPAQKNDVMTAIAFIRDRSPRFSIDPTQVIFLGRSAGGQIAETVAFDPPSELRLSIRGCIAFYAPADLKFAYDNGSDDDLLHSLTLLREFLGGTPQTATANYHLASAYDFVQRDSPPTLLFHGARDPLVWFKQSERLRDRMNSAGQPVLYVELPWATHGFDYNLRGPGGQLSTQTILAFLAAVTQR